MTEILHPKFTLEACKPPPWNLLTLQNFNHTWFNLHNNIRTTSRTQEHLQGNLYLQLQNVTKRTNKISPKANPFVDRAILYFLQQISLILIKKCSQNRRNKIWEREVSAKEVNEQREKKDKKRAGECGDWGRSAGVPTRLAADSARAPPPVESGGCDMQLRIRRARFLFLLADVAPFLSTRARRSRQHAGPTT
jgi:hypothetical protein